MPFANALRISKQRGDIAPRKMRTAATKGAKPMRFRQTTPVPGYRNSYTHTIYFGPPAYDQLEADINQLPATGRTNQYEYWPIRWRAISLYVREWLTNANDDTARAIILHHQGDGQGFGWENWNTLYLASRRYIKTNTNVSWLEMTITLRARRLVTVSRWPRASWWTWTRSTSNRVSIKTTGYSGTLASPHRRAFVCARQYRRLCHSRYRHRRRARHRLQPAGHQFNHQSGRATAE